MELEIDDTEQDPTHGQAAFAAALRAGALPSKEEVSGG